ncbi:hypothetical protein [Rothia nasimurium]|uniref:hypothetical protein n=1 Tax=Rothia nasimurium TaxID=85336 RepID=UPI002DD63490|nr:hypothetical protein [Rothia nasimurium]
MKRNPRTRPTLTDRPACWRPALGMLALVPFLAACAGSGEAPVGETPTQTSAQSSTVSTSATAPASPPRPSSSSVTAAPQYVEDDCLDRCTHYETIEVTHPTLGPVEIRTYGWDMNPGSAPSQMQLAYAVYLDGQPINFYEGLGNTYAFITRHTEMGNMTWNLERGSNIDRFGNIYLATDRSVVVLAPTETGYSQEGTLPSAPVEKPRFEIQPFFDDAGKPAAGLRLGADGQANLVLGRDEEGQVRQVAILGPLGGQNSLAYTSCHSTELNCGFTFEN